MALDDRHAGRAEILVGGFVGFAARQDDSRDIAAAQCFRQPLAGGDGHDKHEARPRGGRFCDVLAPFGHRDVLGMRRQARRAHVAVSALLRQAGSSRKTPGPA